MLPLRCLYNSFVSWQLEHLVTSYELVPDIRNPTGSFLQITLEESYITFNIFDDSNDSDKLSKYLNKLKGTIRTFSLPDREGILWILYFELHDYSKLEKVLDLFCKKKLVETVKPPVDELLIEQKRQEAERNAENEKLLKEKFNERLNERIFELEREEEEKARQEQEKWRKNLEDLKDDLGNGYILNPVNPVNSVNPFNPVNPKKENLEKRWQEKCRNNMGVCAVCNVCGGSSSSFCECAKKRFFESPVSEWNNLVESRPKASQSDIKRIRDNIQLKKESKDF
jgi:hypothetical protein